MTNGEGGEKGGIYQGTGKEVDVGNVSADDLAEIQKQVGETGVELNVDIKTGKAKPKITAILRKGKKLPKEKPL